MITSEVAVELVGKRLEIKARSDRAMARDLASEAGVKNWYLTSNTKTKDKDMANCSRGALVQFLAEA